MALIKYFVDCQNNKCEPLVAVIFGSGSEPLMAFDCTPNLGVPSKHTTLDDDITASTVNSYLVKVKIRNRLIHNWCFVKKPKLGT